jgi:hypothetical protein
MSCGPRISFAEMLNQETGDVRFCQVLVIGDVRLYQVLVTRKRPGIGRACAVLSKPICGRMWDMRSAPRGSIHRVQRFAGGNRWRKPQCGPAPLLWYRSGAANGPAIKVDHDATFAAFTRRFLARVADPAKLPTRERPNLLAKYRVTTGAVAISRR